MKSKKLNTTNPLVSSPPQQEQLKTKMIAGKEEKQNNQNNIVNRSNPWNVDPFVPHYNKPTIFPLKDDVTNSKPIVVQNNSPSKFSL